eukprot:TRINITY_DN47619_c0_g1_i1.p1 TRINITY_DN47619_c0_g1~~TRINITY_DN47619_c0_g1_i1.p1  ORF type:complete len:134 (+),score=10.63 TRINITY_DN47619_c0_g1_i1:63-464(+)
MEWPQSWSTERAATASAAFIAVDRVWWCALLCASYRRAPLDVISKTTLGTQMLEGVVRGIGPSRAQKVSQVLHQQATRAAHSWLGRVLQDRASLDAGRVVLVLPQSIVLYNLSLPFFFPFNGYMAILASSKMS